MRFLQIFLLLFFSTYVFHSTFAQFEATGKVVDNNGNEVEFATVIFKSSIDSTKIHWFITKEQGEFVVKKLEKGLYSLEVRMIGYKTHKEDSILVDKNFVLPTVLLVEDQSQLNEVEITVQKSILQNELGKKVLYVGEDLSTTGSSVAEVMLRIPSVTSTAEGNVRIRGSSNFIIYINGKETKRKASSLRHIPSESIEKIEVITNPAAKYDAEGSAGIVNIVFKKNTKKPIKVDINANLIFPTRRLLGTNVSINKNRFSFFANASHNWGKSITSSIIDRVNQDAELKSYSNDTRVNGKFSYYALNTGVSFKIDSTSNLELSLNYNRWNDLDESKQTNLFNYENKSLNESFNSQTLRSEIEDEMTISLVFDKNVSKNTKLDVLLSAGGENENNYSRLQSTSDEQVPQFLKNLLNSFDGNEEQRLYQLKVDSETKIGKFGSLQTGVKGDFIDYDLYQSVDFLVDSISVTDNIFEVLQQKVGFYALNENKVDRFTYSYGLRLEIFESEGFQEANQQKSEQAIRKLFPFLQLHYTTESRVHVIGFSYAQRIDRPSFFSINPYVSYQDLLNLRTGNPNLKPEIVTLLEGSYQWIGEKLLADFTSFYKSTKDIIQTDLIPLGENQTLETVSNFEKRTDWGGELVVEFSQSKRLNLLATFNYIQTNFDVSRTNTTFRNETSWGFRFNQQLKFGTHWLLDMAQNYRTPRFEPQRKQLEQYYINMSISKKFKNKRGSFSINFTDIFNTREFGEIIFSEGVSIEDVYKYQTRRLTFGSRYSIVK